MGCAGQVAVWHGSTKQFTVGAPVDLGFSGLTKNNNNLLIPKKDGVVGEGARNLWGDVVDLRGDVADPGAGSDGRSCRAPSDATMGTSRHGSNLCFLSDGMLLC